jgi:hypothetical protein
MINVILIIFFYLICTHTQLLDINFRDIFAPWISFLPKLKCKFLNVNMSSLLCSIKSRLHKFRVEEVKHIFNSDNNIVLSFCISLIHRGIEILTQVNLLLELLLILNFKFLNQHVACPHLFEFLRLELSPKEEL